MQLLATRLNVVYERSFRRPVFTVSRSAAEILECFYDALSPDYPLAMSDLSATSAMSMGDIAIRVALFRGNGLLEVRPEKFTARFDGLQSKSDVDVVKSVIRLSENSLNHCLPDVNYKATTIKTSGWSICEGGEKHVRAVLDKYGSLKPKVLPNKFGADNINNALRGRLSNEKQGWITYFAFELSEIAGFHLFSMCDSAYSEDGKYTNFDERTEHFETVYSSLLDHFGFEGVSGEQKA